MYTLPGYRVGLRPIRLDDVDAIMAWINDPTITRNFAGMSKEITREDELAVLQKMIDSPTDKLYAVVGTDGAYLGNAGVHKIYWPARNGRLGVVLGASEAQGKGLGTETMRLITSLGFDELGLHKIWVVHFRENARMRHIVGKLGFQHEGTLRDEYFHAGGFHDMERHSLLEEEYRTTWGRS